MMRKSFLALATVLALAPSPIAAGDLGIFGSYWDTDALGDTAGAGLKFSFGDRAWRFELRGSLFPDVSDDFSELTDGGDGLEVRAVVPEAGFAYYFGGRSASGFHPYLGAGVSYYLLEVDLFGIRGLELDDEVGLYGVLGFETGEKFGFFAEALYRSVEGTVVSDEFVDEAKLDLSGLSANAGLVIRF